jgi:hypothetical protein
MVVAFSTVRTGDGVLKMIPVSGSVIEAQGEHTNDARFTVSNVRPGMDASRAACEPYVVVALAVLTLVRMSAAKASARGILMGRNLL